MLKIKPGKALSPDLLMLMHGLDQAATQLHIPCFVIGATARDILIDHVHGLETTRATRDIDFAVSVASWEAFTRLKEQLIGTGEFKVGEQSHRLTFGEGKGAYPLDLVPFDGVEHHGEIAWPPNERVKKSPWRRCIVSPYPRTVFDDAPCPDDFFTRSTAILS